MSTPPHPDTAEARPASPAPSAAAEPATTAPPSASPASSGGAPPDSEGGAPAPASSAPLLDLPRGSVRKVVKAALAGAAPGGGDVAVSKEALGALGECAKIFLHYITSTANDAARDGKRQTISPADVVAALGDAGFEELAEAAAAGAAGHAAAAAAAASAGTGTARRSSTPGGGGGGGGGSEGAADDPSPPSQKRRVDSPPGAAPAPAPAVGAA